MMLSNHEHMAFMHHVSRSPLAWLCLLDQVCLDLAPSDILHHLSDSVQCD